MPCYYPLKAYRPLSTADGGRYVFDATKALNPDNPQSLPCGKCIGCRQHTAESWAIRCYHESLTSPQSSFLTLTYADQHLPEDYSGSLREVQLFMKRLRKAKGRDLCFFAVSEYGDEARTFRPHYHILLYGCDFRSDRKFFKMTKDGPLYTSASLDEAWQHKGHSTLGSVTLKSAFYCIQYVFDVRGQGQDQRYERIHPVTKQPVRCAKEFRTMSNNLGLEWLRQYPESARGDFIVIDGKQYAVPRYYRRKLSEEDLKKIRRAKIRKDHNDRYTLRVKERKHNNSPERLAVREEIHQAKLNRRRTSL